MNTQENSWGERAEQEQVVAQDCEMNEENIQNTSDIRSAFFCQELSAELF